MKREEMVHGKILSRNVEIPDLRPESHLQINIMGIETQSNNDMQQPRQKNGWLSDLPQFGQQSQFKPTLKKTQDHDNSQYQQ